MKIVVGGASGAIGYHLVTHLLDAGFEVFGITHSRNGFEQLNQQGAEAIMLDALDTNGVHRTIQQIKPEVVIDQLTALPKNYTREAMQAASEKDTQLRLEGGGNLLVAAKAADVNRYIIQSSAFFYAPGAGLADEDTAFAFNASPAIIASTRTYAELENRLLNLKDMEGIALRYGFFYGPGTWFHEDGNMADQVRAQDFPVIGEGTGVWSFVHIDDAAAATVQAITQGKPGAYNIVNDQPAEQRVWLPAFANWLGAPPPPILAITEVTNTDSIYYATQLRGASNTKARQEFNWTPRPWEWLSS
jgi:nucleoside-diphosphate-sugar epimerase